MTRASVKQNEQRLALHFERPPCLCTGAHVIDRTALEYWTRRLFAQHPKWTAPRLQQRAQVEALKGGAGVVSDCTDPNRAACPRMCRDYCNKAEEEAEAIGGVQPSDGGQA